MAVPLPVLPLEILQYQRGLAPARSRLVRLGGWCGAFAFITSVLFLGARHLPGVADKTSLKTVLSILIGRFGFCVLGMALVIIGAVRDRQRLSARLTIAILLNLLALAAIGADGRFWYKWYNQPPLPPVWYD